MGKELVTIADVPVTKVESEAELLEGLLAQGKAKEIFWYPVNANLELIFGINREGNNKVEILLPDQQAKTIEVFCHDIGVSGLARAVSKLLRDKISEALPGSIIHDFVIDYQMNQRRGLGLFQPGSNAPCFTIEQALEMLASMMRLEIADKEVANKVANK